MFCNKFSERMFLLWHWCQRGRKESSSKCFGNRFESSKCFGNRFEPDWSNAEESWMLSANVAINAKGGDCWQFQLSESKSAYTCHWWQERVAAVMTTTLNNSAVIIERRRDSDRWIPSKFPERTRTVRSVEAAREIKSSENRGSRFQYAKFTRQRKPRNRDTRFRDLIAAVKSSRDLDRSFVWTRGSQEASSSISRIGIYDKNFEHQTSRNRDTRFPDKRYRLWATQELNAGQV